MATTEQRIAEYHKYFGNPKSIHVHNMGSASMIASAAPAPIAVFQAWDVEKDNWDGYAKGGYKVKDATPFTRITFNDDPNLYIILSGKNGLTYAEAFITQEETADANGDHYAVHPIHVFEVDWKNVGALNLAIDVANRQHRYPEFDALPIDRRNYGRWKKYVVSPKYNSVSVNLRCIPTTASHPVGKLDQQIQIWMIPDASEQYPGWAMGVFAGVRAWINQGVIRMAKA